MAGITQHFSSLQVGIELRQTGRHDINKNHLTTGLEHPMHLAQSASQILPVMCRVTTKDEIETGTRKRQIFSNALLQLDVIQTTLNRRRFNRIQHRLG